MPSRPGSGTLAFLFTDLEASTRLWERHPDVMPAALERHDQLLRDAVEQSGGIVVKTTGDGLMAVFTDAGSAVRAALDAQRSLTSESWQATGPLRVRMGLHAGTAHAADGDFHGPVVNRTARIMAVAHGGQVLLSGAVAALVADDLPGESNLRDLGEHRLKDLERAERLFELTHPDLLRDFPALASLSERPNNLPTQTSLFVGRDRELAQIRELLARGDVRLVTLLGPGGTGKTRLALQAASDHIDQFDDGAYFVDLAPAREGASVPAFISRAVGLEETPREDPGVAQLVQQLRPRSVLLVLDNFEQLTAAGPAVAELLAECPRIKAVVTSREALRLRGEHVVTVPPLGLPDPDHGEASLAEIVRSEAVQLFVDRARAVTPEFDLTDANAAAVAAICVHLDGLPLAIELAAARLSLFSVQALVDRLRDSTRVLGTGPRDLPTRQQTLHDTIAWSVELLEPTDRALFCLLSAFSGIGVDALEGVADELRARLPDGFDVIESLASLVDKSLVRRDEDASGAPRFAMLRTIREHAAERLAEDPELEAAIHSSHAQFFASFAHRRASSIGRRKRTEVLAEIAPETGNLEAAWRYWVNAGELGHLDGLVGSLWLVYDARGWHRATVDLTTDMLAVLDASPPTPDRALQQITFAMSLARVLLSTKGYTEEVEHAYSRALRLAEEQGSALELFPVLRGLASLYNFRVDFAKATETALRLLDVAERHDDAGMRLEAHLLCAASIGFDDIEAGIEHVERAIELMDPEVDMARSLRVGPYPGVASLTTAAFLLWVRGRPDRSLAHADRALQIAEDLEHPITMAYAHYHVGFLQLHRERPDVSLERAAVVREVAREFDLPLWTALGDCLEGTARTRTGDADAGLEQLERGLELYQELIAPPVFWPLLLWIKARALGESGRASEGVTVIDEAIRLVDADVHEGLLAAEFAITRGDLLTASTDGPGDDTLRTYERALDVATRGHLGMSRLRAATRIYRQLRDGPREAAARGQLAAAYDEFTEGLATQPLVEAEALLAEST